MSELTSNETFNLSLRRFLKRLGISSQQQIEASVLRAMEEGSLVGARTIKVRAVIELPDTGLVHAVDGEIELK